METDIRSTETTDFNSTRTTFEVEGKQTDGPSDQKETEWDSPNFSIYYGYYDEIPELKKAIGTYGTWVLGQGWTASNLDTAILESIAGWGEDDFTSILWNMLIMKKINGDSFAEIKRNEKTGTLINIIPLTPSRISIVVGNDGVITKYKYMSPKLKEVEKEFQPNEIFHLCNDRVADNIHGDSVVSAMKWLIDSRQEAMKDWRRISHRSSIRILFVDEDDTAKLKTLNAQYSTAIENGDVMIFSGKKENFDFEDLTLPPVEAYLAWIRYLENAFYKGVGVPKTLAGDAEGIPESGGKMVVLTHEPTYIREVTNLENDIWNQLAIRVEFKRQASLKESVNDTENKNINQTQATQPSDTQA